MKQSAPQGITNNVEVEVRIDARGRFRSKQWSWVRASFQLHVTNETLELHNALLDALLAALKRRDERALSVPTKRYTYRKVVRQPEGFVVTITARADCHLASVPDSMFEQALRPLQELPATMKLLDYKVK